MKEGHMKKLNQFISRIDLGTTQQHRNMAVLPLLHPIKPTASYITLKEALENNVLTVKEVDKQGSVPELKVINRGDIPVLLLDGEELVGAKQNRVLNTSILLEEKSETIIPVSCTEAGRWSFKSEHFEDSGVVMAASARMTKNFSVSESLAKGQSFRSDQGRVWDDIDELSSRAEVHSTTGAMRDVFEKRKKEIEDYLNAFTLVPSQRGLLVIINNKVIGFDIVSLDSVYNKLHQKLVKSYAMEAWVESKNEIKDKDSLSEKAKSFLKQTEEGTWKRFKSVGYGWDYRFRNDKLVGSTLFNNEVIHMAFFIIPEQESDDNIADVGARIRNRM